MSELKYTPTKDDVDALIGGIESIAQSLEFFVLAARMMATAQGIELPPLQVDSAEG